MKVSVAALSPDLRHMPHNLAQSVVITVVMVVLAENRLTEQFGVRSHTKEDAEQ